METEKEILNRIEQLEFENSEPSNKEIDKEIRRLRRDVDTIVSHLEELSDWLTNYVASSMPKLELP